MIAVDPRLGSPRIARSSAIVSTQLGVLGADLVGLERGQAGEAHVEDRLRLDLGELELLDQARAGDVGVGRGADQLDHRVEVVERDQQALEDVGAGLGRRSSYWVRRVTTSRWWPT